MLEAHYSDHRRGLGLLSAPPGDGHQAGGGHAMNTGVDDDLWSAIGDPTRRRMIDLLLAEGRRHRDDPQRPSARHPAGRDQASRPCSTGPASCRSTPAGRERRYDVDEAQLARAVAQLPTVGAMWDARLQRVKHIAEALQQTREPKTAARECPRAGRRSARRSPLPETHNSTTRR